jgi:tetratricopeptide (TPR) repeat protein
MGLGLFRTGRANEAVAHWRESLEIKPDNMNAQANLAWVLATSPDASLRDGAKAIELARKVLEHAGHANVTVLRTLAAGYAESGRFSEAIETAQQALQLAIAQGNTALTEDLQLNIANYRRSLHCETRELGIKLQHANPATKSDRTFGAQMRRATQGYKTSTSFSAKPKTFGAVHALTLQSR